MARRTAFTVFPLVIVALIAAVLFLLALDRPPMVSARDVGAFGFEPGELVADFDYRDADGERGSLASLLDGREALVIALGTSACPMPPRFGERLASLGEEYGRRGVRFVYVDANGGASKEDARGEAERSGFAGPYVLDRGAAIAGRLQAVVAPEVFVIDRARTMRYRGALDGASSALADVLDGHDVQVARTDASGCDLEYETATLPQREVTYHSRVSRILNQNCVTCHRAGGVGPFALDSFARVSAYLPLIQSKVSQDLMPPWYASRDYGEWANDRSLSERDKRDLLAWIDGGAPEGNPALAVLPRHLKEGWQLGIEPDTIITIPAAQQIPAEGVLDYRHVYVPTHWPEDRWVRAAEVVPTAKDVTHHVIVYLEDENAEERGGWLVGYAPGTMPAQWGEGYGKRIPAGQTLMFELHYTTNGKTAVDDTRLGLYFADEPSAHEVYMAAVGTEDFEIPPHASNQEVIAELEFDRPGEILSLLPHMHLRGKAFRYDIVHADGTEETILEVPHYDFKWQLTYEPVEPFEIHAGDKLRGTAWYDNSEANPANTDPGSPVRYGKQSFEEMMFGFFEWVPGAVGGS